MKRLLLLVAGLLAGALVAAPALLALNGNTSFSRDLPVPVPSGAHRIQLSDFSPSTAGREPEPGDDRGRSSSEPGDDRSPVGVQRREDPRGPSLPSVSDDHGGLRDRSGSGRDDGSGHGGRGRDGGSGRHDG
jgi:hypothetical protein